MKYLQEREVEVMDLLRSNKSDQEIARWVSEKILESYRNGIKAGQNGAVVKRDGKSRRPFPPQAR